MEASLENQDGIHQGMEALSMASRADLGEQLQLHAASAVFRNEVLNGLGTEIDELERENAHFRYLKDLIQNVAVHILPSDATTRSRPAPLIDFALQQDRTIIMTAQLSQGATSFIDGREILVIPLEAAPTVPAFFLVPATGAASFGSISVILAGVAVAAFPTADSRAEDANTVQEEGGFRATLCLSENVSITGEYGTSLVNVEEADAEYTNDDEDFIERLDIIPTFTPSSISIALSPRLRKTRELLEQLSATIDHSMDQDDLRCLTVTALGEDEHKQTMNRYLQLTHENGILAVFRKMILEVVITYPGGSFCTALDEGVYNGRYGWYVLLDGEDSACVAVSDIGLIGLSFSGIRLKIDLTQTLQTLQTLNINEREVNHFLYLVFTCRLCPSKKFFLGLEVNWHDLTVQERRDFLNEFETNVWNASFERRSTFPSHFEFNIAYIEWDMSVAATYLALNNLE